MAILEIRGQTELMGRLLNVCEAIKRRRWLQISIGFVCLVGGLFFYTGLETSWRTPEVGSLAIESASVPDVEIRILTWNIAKCFAFGRSFDVRDPEKVRESLDLFASVIRESKADIVCLTEIVWECGPCPVNQVVELAERSELPHYAYGDNYAWGLPFYKIRAGNAILSRIPLTGIEVRQLTGGAPFFAPVNRRRILWCRLNLGNEELLLASLRNDSFLPSSNLVQTGEILTYLKGRPAILAGDFNATPDSESMKRYRESELFTGNFSGPPSFFLGDRGLRIDYVLAPKSWQLISETVLEAGGSDHKAVLAVFRRGGLDPHKAADPE